MPPMWNSGCPESHTSPVVQQEHDAVAPPDARCSKHRSEALRPVVQRRVRAHLLAQDERHAIRVRAPAPADDLRLRMAAVTSRLTTFSDGVRGKSSKTSTNSGHVYLATPSASRNCWKSSRVGATWPTLRMTAAQPRSPSRSSGSGTIATSWMAGWRMSTDSTSAGTIVTPPRRMMSLLRPT